MTKNLLLLALGLALLVAPVSAVNVQMTDEERAECAAGGGCAMVTRQWVMEQMQAAHKAGQAECSGKRGASI